MSLPDGIGAVLSKVFNWLPKKEEHLKNKINKLKREMDDILTKDSPLSARDAGRYERLAHELRNVEERLQNRT